MQVLGAQDGRSLPAARDAMKIRSIDFGVVDLGLNLSLPLLQQVASPL